MAFSSWRISASFLKAGTNLVRLTAPGPDLFNLATQQEQCCQSETPLALISRTSVEVSSFCPWESSASLSLMGSKISLPLQDCQLTFQPLFPKVLATLCLQQTFKKKKNWIIIWCKKFHHILLLSTADYQKTTLMWCFWRRQLTSEEGGYFLQLRSGYTYTGLCHWIYHR